jgi:hypothetical protein
MTVTTPLAVTPQLAELPTRLPHLFDASFSVRVVEVAKKYDTAEVSDQTPGRNVTDSIDNQCRPRVHCLRRSQCLCLH